MRAISDNELKEILDKHLGWVVSNRSIGVRADLSGAILKEADLRDANLNGAVLRGADLRDADLRYADLSGANLKGINLSGVDLSGAKLTDAYLSFTNLSGADLRDADLRYADLRYADLRDAVLRHADLRVANLRYADLRGADLSYADLKDAVLSRADLSGAEIFVPMACPEEGSFIGYKKAGNNYIVKLEILSDAKRCSGTGRKCRCSKARVLSITKLDGTTSCITSISSKFDSDFVYKIGEIVSVPDFDEDRWNECSTGIHFFITREEAVKYNMT